MRMRWAGFRKVRGQVRKRLARRLTELGLPDAAAYQEYLDRHPGEWTVLDSLCRITISRFYRDRGVFDAIRTVVLPDLARRVVKDGVATVRCWCVGCASGEEPYSLGIVWKHSIEPMFGEGVRLEIVATEANREMLERAIRGRYTRSSLKDLPGELAAGAFERLSTGHYAINERFKRGVHFIHQDIRDSHPAGMFHLVLCRNLVFTYFDKELQQEVLERIIGRLVPGGYLVVGIHESIPGGFPGLIPREGTPGIYRCCGGDGPKSASI